MELQIVLHTLFRRISTLALAAPLEELPFKYDALAYGIYELLQRRFTGAGRAF